MSPIKLSWTAKKPLFKISCIQLLIEIPPRHAKKRTIPTSSKSQNLNTTKEHSLSKIICQQAGPQIPPTQNTSNKSQHINTGRETKRKTFRNKHEKKKPPTKYQEPPVQGHPSACKLAPSQKHKKNEDKKDKETHTYRRKKKHKKTYKQTKTINQISRATCPGPSANRLACRFHRSRLKRMNQRFQKLLLCSYMYNVSQNIP